MMQFARRRLARLYPLHLFALLMFLVLQGVKMVVETWGGDTRHHAFEGLNVTNFTDTLLLLQSTGLLWHEISWNSPSWSISTELFANLLVFALLLSLGRRYLNLICGVLLVCTIAFFVAGNIGPHDYGPLALMRCIAGFSLGCLVHELFVSTAHNKLVGAAGLPLVRTAAEALALVALLGGIVAKHMTGIWFLSSCSFAVVIYVFAFETGLISRAIERTGLAWFGTISYSVYLNHIFVGSLLSGAFLAVAGQVGLAGPVKIMVFVAFFFTVLSAYSWLTYQFIELPAQRYFSSRRRTAASLA
jgi:peptidoglycan/LPS O-acetylase OafA/YrhL